MLMMVPYIAASRGWRLIGQYGEMIEETSPLYQSWSTIMWGIRNSGEIVKHFRNGVHVATSHTVNPAIFLSGILAVAIVIAVVYFLITYATVFIMISPLVVVPYKLLRNYILHR